VLAQQSQGRKEYAAAASGYKAVLAQDPDNAVALNNLAWILADAKDPSAREYAERAYSVAPLDPNVVDTLGWTLVRTGDPTRGLQLLRMASALAPGQNEIRLHLAQALAQSGDKAGARREAEPLTKLDAASPIRAEAEKLLATL
jgi:predicted Zn-dependent protease